MKTFKEVRNFLDKVSFINSGGCAISALSMHRWLKQKNKPSKFVYLYRWREDFEQNQKALNDSKVSPASCTHAGVLYRKKIYDSRGVVDPQRFAYIHIFNNENFIINSINDLDIWNDLFERSSVDYISENLNINLSDIEK